jgi:hypothetical protein
MKSKNVIPHLVRSPGDLFIFGISVSAVDEGGGRGFLEK